MRILPILLGLAACGNLQGFGGPVPPLASFTVEATGAAPPGSHLQVALVWGRQWLVEPMCILYALQPDPRDVRTDVLNLIAAGCRDPFGFVPALVAANAPVELNTPATIDLFQLPGADVMVGDLTARVAYGGFVLYDDVDQDGTLTLAAPNRPPEMGPPNTGGLPTTTADVVYGASFIAMTSADQRVAYREGAFDEAAAFYPRAGCSDPPPGFSILSAGGFSFTDAIMASVAGTLPQEDPASCATQAPAGATVTFQVQSSGAVQTPPFVPDLPELRCTERSTDATVRYREPDPMNMPDITGRTTACVHYPSIGAPSDVIEWVVSGVVSPQTGQVADPCAGLTHFILKGCREGPDCGTPDWDHSLAPPTWWPCPLQ